MNTQTNNKIVSIEKYFEILGKESKLDAKETVQKEEMKNYLEDCQALEDKGLLPESARPSLAKYEQKMVELQDKPEDTRTSLEQAEIIKFQARMEQNQEEKEYGRVLNKKAGYVDAIVILVVLINVGFIIAMAILGNR